VAARDQSRLYGHQILGRGEHIARLLVGFVDHLSSLVLAMLDLLQVVVLSLVENGLGLVVVQLWRASRLLHFFLLSLQLCCEIRLLRLAHGFVCKRVVYFVDRDVPS
jgi:hypothetical protein